MGVSDESEAPPMPRGGRILVSVCTLPSLQDEGEDALGLDAPCLRDLRFFPLLYFVGLGIAELCGSWLSPVDRPGGIDVSRE